MNAWQTARADWDACRDRVVSRGGPKVRELTKATDGFFPRPGAIRPWPGAGGPFMRSQCRPPWWTALYSARPMMNCAPGPAWSMWAWPSSSEVVQPIASSPLRGRLPCCSRRRSSRDTEPGRSFSTSLAGIGRVRSPGAPLKMQHTAVGKWAVPLGSNYESHIGSH